MVKNIQNSGGSAGGVVDSTDDIPEGISNLYYTSARVATAIANDPNYGNAESIFGLPITGPASGSGQVLLFNGSGWVTQNDLELNNSNLTISAGPAATPDAYYGREGPISYNKASGNQKILTVTTTAPNSGVLTLYITARDDVTGTKYQSSEEFLFENAATVLTETFLHGYQSSEFTRAVVGETFEVSLNTVNATTVTLVIQYQTVTGGDLTFSIP